MAAALPEKKIYKIITKKEVMFSNRFSWSEKSSLAVDNLLFWGANSALLANKVPEGRAGTLPCSIQQLKALDEIISPFRLGHSLLLKRAAGEKNRMKRRRRWIRRERKATFFVARMSRFRERKRGRETEWGRDTERERERVVKCKDGMTFKYVDCV